MTKKKAFLIHLSISTAVVGSVLAIIYFLWYPDPYLRMSGAFKVIGMLVGVDLILGPSLTLMLYKPKKPRLVFDLSVIAIIQLSALIYGTASIYEERPYYMVFVVDRFEVVPQKDINESLIEAGVLKAKPWAAPILAVALLPQDRDEQQKLLMELLEGKPDIERRPEYWSPYEEHIDAVRARAKPLGGLKAEDEKVKSNIARLFLQYPEDGRLLYLPVKWRGYAFTLVFDGVTFSPVETILVDPWDLDTS